jgi:selenide,water dikinase
LCGLEIPTNDSVIVGMDSLDDAGVYKISDDLAIIQTVDFFTPIVDDPYRFGQIAAANALSDIYAMGGIPKTAMNLVGFPLKQMDISILRQIIQGGLDKMKEADVVLIGGHSVEDRELKYGLSVTGFVHPDRILTKKNLNAGDRMVLTKPLGTGVINTAIKGGVASSEVIERVTQLMAALNRDAAEVMNKFRVHACTDITGFGLLGHLAEMIVGSGCGLTLDAENIPVLPEAIDYAAMGLLPGGAFKNKEFREPMVEFSSSVNPIIGDLLFDPQTSGGLLICLAKNEADKLVNELHQKGIDGAAVIGEVVSAPPEKILVN